MSAERGRCEAAAATAPVVLVAYASRNGGTAGIAEWIGAVLAEEGLDARVVPAAAVRDMPVPAPAAVVLGSGLYTGRWLRAAVRFTRRHRAALLCVPVWLFSSGPLDAGAATRDIPPTDQVAHTADRVDAAEHMTFGGRLVPGARGAIARMMLRRGQGGDYRDPARVTAWARRIAEDVHAAER